MPFPLTPLPAALGDQFSSASARSMGIGSCRLGRSDLEVPFRGVRRRIEDTRRFRDACAGLHPHEIWRREQIRNARALATVLPQHAFFSHHTAAAIWGLPINPPRSVMQEVKELRRRNPDLDERIDYLRQAASFGAEVSADLNLAYAERRERDRGVARVRAQVDVGVALGTAHVRRAGVRASRIKPELIDVVGRGGLRVTDPASTWALAASRMTLEDAVALGDAVIREVRRPGTEYLDRPPYAGREELSALLSRGRRPGIRLLRNALELLSPHSASPPESHLRLLLHSWDLPEPSLDHDVYSDSGILLGASEFAWPWLRLVIEQEGDHHRTEARQWNRDIRKVQSYQEAGWETIRSTGTMLYRKSIELRGHIEHRIRARIDQLRSGVFAPAGPIPAALPERFRW